MSRLGVARDDQIDAIYRESYRIWGGGLTFEGYRELWSEQCRTPWGSRYARFYVWTDDRGRVLSSLKLYRPRLRVFGRTARATVIGAVFTPAERRGQGHARSMVQETIARARCQGDLLMLLFSDIGVDYYASMGFAALPAEEQAGKLPGISGRVRPGWRLRDMQDADEPAVQRIHDDYCAAREFTVLRDANHWRFIRVRSEGFFRRLAGRQLRARQQVVLHDGEIIGYLIAVEGDGDWNVREVGAVGGDPETMAEVLKLGAHQAHGSGLRGFFGWLPPEVKPYLDARQVRSRPRARAVPMMLGLGDETERLQPTSVEMAYLSYQDQF